MKFEIINPSDGCTMEADSFKVAAIVNCLLGEGKYGLKQLDCAEGEARLEMPLFLWLSPDPWFIETFGADFESCAQDVLENHTEALARCFESITLINGKRSSINDICGYAHETAKGIRARIAAKKKLH